MTARGEPSFTRAAGLIAGGLLVWAVHFIAIYGFVGLACARPSWNLGGDSWSAAQFLVLLATALAAAALLALARLARRAPDRFVGRVAFGSALLALIAVLLEGAAALLVPACA